MQNDVLMAEVKKWKDFSLILAEEHDKLQDKNGSERERDHRIIKAMKDQNEKLKKLLKLKDDQIEKSKGAKL